MAEPFGFHLVEQHPLRMAEYYRNLLILRDDWDTQEDCAFWPMTPGEV